MQWFGRHIENKISKYDRNKHGDFDDYTRNLLADDRQPQSEQDNLRQLIAMFGVLPRHDPAAVVNS